MARIVFTTLGSLGDLHPMLPVADRVRAGGHEVLFAVPTHLAPTVEGEGFACHRINTRPFAPAPRSTDPAAVRAKILQRLPELLSSTIEVLLRVCQGADLMVTHPHQLAAAMTARKLGLPWITLTVYPGLIPSAYTVPEPHWLPPLPTPAGRAVNRLTWRVFRYGLRHLSGDILDATIAAQGLERDDDIFMPGGLSPYLTLILTSPAYSPRQPDWPDHVKVTGYTPWDEPRGWRDPPELERFVAGGDAPVLVTTSSAGERDVVSFFRSAVRSLQLSKRRGLLLLGRAARDFSAEAGTMVAPDIQAWPYLPLSRVVARSSLVVHHGGAGTSLTTVRHGRPAVAVPAIFDQWYNAKRIKSLGLGRVLEWRRFTAERLAGEMNAVAGTPGYREHAEALGNTMAREDGAGRASEEIEGLLATRASPA
jgi:rhamnosyltransferase subunit B